MCLELMYENFENRGLVDFAYLAIEDKMIINKSFIETDEDFGEIIQTHGGHFNSHIFLQFNDEENNKILTALLNFEDINLDNFEENWPKSLTKVLTDLSNNNMLSELEDNVMTMFFDAFHNAGFCGTYVSKLIDEAFDKSKFWFCRTVDFQMHEPSLEDLHPGYDT